MSQRTPTEAGRRPNSSVDWFEAGYDRLWLPYTQMRTAPPPLPVVRTEGVRIHLADGRVLIDGVASWWTACHGYNHPHIRQEVARQLETMPHVMFGGLVHGPALTLAARLTALLPDRLSRVFFSESGSVSVEIALKMAIQYWINLGVPGRRRLISFEGAYHGDTIGAMSVCDPEEGMHALFRSVLPEQYVLPLPRTETDFDSFDEFLAQRSDECAAVVIEPLVQGAGGMRMHDADCLRRIRRACEGHDLLLIFDEIMTGFGRTGSMFALEQAGVTPDIVTLSKALTGGTLPLAATIATEQVFDAFLSDDASAALMHGPTFMANPLACAAANASLDLFENEPRLAQIKAIEAQLEDELAPCRDMAGVVDLRVKGAIGVVQLEPPLDLDGLRQRFVEEGVWIRPFGDIVYLTPAFTIDPQDLSELTGAVVRVVRDWSAR